MTADHPAQPPATFCRFGCYWDGKGRPLRRCHECGKFFYDAVAHGHDHERMRQLGWLPERWPRGGGGWQQPR
ncbi:MAG: hypothetical protein EXR63_06040 [Dehalococcoidia bacterium]|nr:hypothetical protein [Dehalococcoidia bacterium]